MNMNQLTVYPQHQNQQNLPTAGTNLFQIQNLKKSFLEDYSYCPDNYVHNQFIRQQSRELLDFLDQRFTDFIQNVNHPLLTIATVEGASGGGKSTEAWAWFQLKKQHSRAWIHHFTKNVPIYGVVIITNNLDGTSTYQNGSFTDIGHVISAIQDVDIVVVDGAFIHHEYYMMFDLAKIRHKFLVTVMSDQSADLKPAMDRHFHNEPTFIVNGFSVVDYIAAEPLIAPFLGRVPYTNDQIEERFFYCGGSARYFWGFENIDKLLKLFDKIIATVSSYSVISQGDLGQAAKDFRNSLYTFQDGQPTFVSEYVSRQIAEKIDIGYIESLKDVNPENASWQSWVCKLQFLYYCKLVQQSSNLMLELKNPTGTSIFKKRIQKIHKFCRVNDIPAATMDVNHVNSAHNVLYVPTFFNHGGYDAAFVEYRSNNRPMIHVLRCDIATSHDKKLQYTAQLAQRLFPLDNHPFGDIKVRYYIVTKKDNIDRFNMDEGVIEGLAEIMNFDGNFANDPHRFKLVYYDKDIGYTKKRGYRV